MQLLREISAAGDAADQRNNIRMRFLGRADELPAAVQRDTREAMEATEQNTAWCLALRSIMVAGRKSSTLRTLCWPNAEPPAIRKNSPTADVERHLYTSGLPDPDLLIRTSGEMRVSNFLLCNRLCGNFCHGNPVADFNRARLLEAFRRIPETRSPLWRHRRKRRVGSQQFTACSQIVLLSRFHFLLHSFSVMMIRQFALFLLTRRNVR